jgi:uncharacterized protein
MSSDTTHSEDAMTAYAVSADGTRIAYEVSGSGPATVTAPIVAADPTPPLNEPEGASMNTTGEPCWIQLSTDDVDTAISFYGGLYGWAVGEASEELGGYRMFLRGDEPVAGLVPAADGIASTWSVFLQSPDLSRTLERATASGGRVLVEPMQIADLGWSAEVVDPAGAAVGVWQPDTFPGFVTRAEEGAPAWFETLTTSYDDAVAFYRDAFGWDTHVMSDTAEFRYSTLGHNENARAGVMDASGFLGSEPARWQFYVQVADTDETEAKAVAAGGQVVVAAEDTPYGRIATLEDPSGVRFSVLGPDLEAG